MVVVLMNTQVQCMPTMKHPSVWGHSKSFPHSLRPPSPKLKTISALNRFLAGSLASLNRYFRIHASFRENWNSDFIATARLHYGIQKHCLKLLNLLWEDQRLQQLRLLWWEPNDVGRQNQLPLEVLQVLFTTQGRKGITAKPVIIPFKALSEMICFLLSKINKAHLPWKPKSPALSFLKKHTMHQFWEQLQEVSFNKQPALK